MTNPEVKIIKTVDTTSDSINKSNKLTKQNIGRQELKIKLNTRVKAILFLLLR